MPAGAEGEQELVLDRRDQVVPVEAGLVERVEMPAQMELPIGAEAEAAVGILLTCRAATAAPAS